LAFCGSAANSTLARSHALTPLSFPCSSSTTRFSAGTAPQLLLYLLLFLQNNKKISMFITKHGQKKERKEKPTTAEVQWLVFSYNVFYKTKQNE